MQTKPNSSFQEPVSSSHQSEETNLEIDVSEYVKAFMDSEMEDDPRLYASASSSIKRENSESVDEW